MLGEVKKTTKAAVGVVEKVAEVTEKIAMEVAEALPENTKLKQVALEVEEIAEVVDKEAKLAETILEEVLPASFLISPPYTSMGFGSSIKGRCKCWGLSSLRRLFFRPCES